MRTEVQAAMPLGTSLPSQHTKLRTGRAARGPVVAVLGLIALVAIVIVHLTTGSTPLGVGHLWSTLIGAGDPTTEAVVMGSRIPRTGAGLVAGVALGLSGSVIQGVTRNPLAAPDTLGVNAGAYLALALVATLGTNVGVLPQGGAAFLGGLAAATLVYLMAGRSGIQSPGRVLLAGTAVALAATSAAMLLMLLDEQSTQGLFFWGNGSLLQAGSSRAVMMGAVLLGVALALPLLVRPLDLLGLGDDTAEALGVRVPRVRIQGFLISVAFSAAAVTVAGPIAFVGLVAPIATRMLGVRPYAWRLPVAALAGAVLVLAADVVAQSLLVGGISGEIPVGVVTALVGGPVFLLMARQLPTGGVDMGAAVTVSHTRSGRGYAFLLVIVAVVMLAAIVVGLSVGPTALPPAQILLGAIGIGDPAASAILAFRLPRVIAAVVGGACLATAGAAVQAVIRNPLAEPGLLGVTGGSSVAAVGVISLLPNAPRYSIPLGAFVGGVAALGIVVGVAHRGGRLEPTRVILVGIGLAATTAAVVQVLALRSHLAISAALTWLAGSTYGRNYADLSWTPALLALVAVVVVLTRPLDMLALGDDLPASLGLSVTKARIASLLASAALAAGAAAIIGAVAFVGLVAPHLARRIVGAGHRRMLPTSMLLGATLVVVADTVGRLIIEPRQIPVGVVTALIGAPYLIWLMRRQSARS